MGESVSQLKEDRRTNAPPMPRGDMGTPTDAIVPVLAIGSHRDITLTYTWQAGRSPTKKYRKSLKDLRRIGRMNMGG